MNKLIFSFRCGVCGKMVTGGGVTIITWDKDNNQSHVHHCEDCYKEYELNESKVRQLSTI